MSVLDDVLAQTRRGATPASVARRLRLDEGLVHAALDHWERAGVLTRRSRGSSRCDTCPPPAPASALPVACAGCPLARR